MVSLPLSAKDLDAIQGELPSPDGSLVAFATPQDTDLDVHGRPYSFGTKLYVRRARDSKEATLLLTNGRWMAAQWGPQSHLLGIEDHSDGHISQIYVYDIEVTGTESKPVCKLVFHAPENGYNVKWVIEGWDIPRRIIRLRKEWIQHLADFSGSTDFSHRLGKKTEVRSFVIGTKATSPLK